MAYYRVLQHLENYPLYLKYKQHKSTDTEISFHIKHNAIRNIAFKIVKDISDNDYGEISTIEKNAENWYYLGKCTSDSYTLQSSHNIGRDVIKVGELVCDAVYLNPFANFNKWYTPNGKKLRGNKY